MNIVYVVHALSGGGAERQLSYLSEFIASSKNKLTVIYRDSGPLGNNAEVKNVKYIKLKTKGNYNPLILLELRRILLGENADVVQSWILQFDVILGLLKLVLKFNWISREPNAGSNYKGFKNKYLREKLLRRAEIIVCNSPQGYRYWNGRHPKVVQVLNGFNLKEGSKRCTLSNKQLEISYGDYMLYVGRLVKHKNVELLIKSFAASRAIEKYCLLICGTGSEKEYLDNLIKSVGGGDRIKMLGFMPKENVDLLMEKAKLLCLLSEYEGMPNVVFEAMMKKVPVLLSPSISHKALFTTKTVLFTDSFLQEDVTSKLDSFNNYDRGAEMLKNAYQYVSKCSIENMAKNYLDIYSEL